MCDPDWRDKKYSFIAHRECEYFPCHKGVPEEDFNCLFCYCPLYFTGDECGGRFTYTKKGIKNCIDCPIPHRRENYGYIIERLTEAMEKRKRRPEECQDK